MSASILVLCLAALAVPAVQADTTVRKTLIDELRSARQQIEPEGESSALRNDIIRELRLAREQTEPAKPARSALRDEIIAELRSAREQSNLKEAPSALRQEIIQELRNARQQVLSEQETMKIETIPAPEPAAPVVQKEQELPWDDAEELLTDAAPLNKVVVPVASATSAMAESVVAFNRFLRTLVLYGTALGLASLAKLPELDLKTQGRSPGYVVTLALFFVPLLATSVDFVFDLAIGNEFALIAGCWGLGAMACVHERVKQQ